MLCAGLHGSVSIAEFSLLLPRQWKANCIHFSRRPIRGGGGRLRMFSSVPDIIAPLAL